MKLTQLFTIVSPHDGSLQDAPDMLTMGNSRAVVTIVKTLDRFRIAIRGLCQPVNYVHGRSALDCIPQVRQFVNFSQMWLVMNGGSELLPKRPPVQDVAIKPWDLNPWEVDSIHQRHFDYPWNGLFLYLLREARYSYP